MWGKPETAPVTGASVFHSYSKLLISLCVNSSLVGNKLWMRRDSIRSNIVMYPRRQKSGTD